MGIKCIDNTLFIDARYMHISDNVILLTLSMFLQDFLNTCQEIFSYHFFAQPVVTSVEQHIDWLYIKGD